ncbi:DUF6463 family protein [Streptomyces buecherae]|uniref:DUF6463 family protein n=1 Tax=Streptomyces buecherae TaxID=2763006 RepID=UPI003407EF6B
MDTEADGSWPREASVWCMAAGVTLLALGTLTRHIVRATGRVPAQLGRYLLLIGVPTAAIYAPVTGSWALIGIGALVLADRRPARGSRARPRHRRTSPATRRAAPAAPARRPSPVSARPRLPPGREPARYHPAHR